MNLTSEQKATVSTWISAGASIAEVQKRLREEFKISLTYIDTRFLIDDLGLNLKNTAPAKPAADLAATKTTPAAAAPGGAVPSADAELMDDEAGFDDSADAFPDESAADPLAPAGGAGSVKVDVDRITRPGTVVSGTVTFSDGNSGKWGLDQFGRLVFEGATPGYRPSQADLQTFQRELSAQLQRHGY